MTNFGDGTISSYVDRRGRHASSCSKPVAASTDAGVKGVRDEAITGDGRFLYALDADAQRVIYGWAVGEDGKLDAGRRRSDGLPADGGRAGGELSRPIISRGLPRAAPDDGPPGPRPARAST